jgi:hypothetical protein
MSASGPPEHDSSVYPRPSHENGGARTNLLAVLALVAVPIAPVVAIVLGLLARREITRTGEAGWRLATAGVILGIVFTLPGLAIIAFFLIFR